MSVEALQAAYTGVHVTAAAVISVVALRVHGSLGGDARRWFLGFMGLSATWSAVEAVRIAAGTAPVTAGLYLVSLVVGLYTVAAFVTFVSAVTGRDFHLDRRVRVGGVAVLLAVTALKTTNPVHGLYFGLTPVEVPFPHVEVEVGRVHWAVTGLAYAASGVGMYHLYDLFRESGTGSRGLAVLFGLFPVPLVLTLLATDGPGFLLGTFYEPIGVAVFALALAWAVDVEFGDATPRARRHLLQQIEFPVAIVEDEVVVESNDRFDAFAETGTLAGTPVASLPRALRAVLSGDAETVPLTYDGTRRVYRASVSEVTLGPHRLARAVVLFDVSAESRRVAEIRRQNRELENVGEVLAHELRNTSAIITGHLETVEADLSDESLAGSVRTAADAADRIDTVVGNLLATLDHSRSVESLDRIDVERICSQFADPRASVEIDDDGTLVGDATRVEFLFENAYGFARTTDTSALEIDVTEGRLTLAFAGAGVGGAESDRVFEHGRSIPHADAGMYLPAVGLVADAHHWRSTASVRDDADAQPELVVTIETDPAPPADPGPDPVPCAPGDRTRAGTSAADEEESSPE